MAKKKPSTKGTLVKKKAMAFDMFMSTDESLKTIGEITGTNYDTLSRWHNTGKWKEQKAANSITREKNIQMMLVQVNNLLNNINSRPDNEQYPTPGEADTITKMTKNIRDMSGRISLPDYFNVLNEFLKSLAVSKPDQAKNIALSVKAFLQQKTRELDA